MGDALFTIQIVDSLHEIVMGEELAPEPINPFTFNVPHPVPGTNIDILHINSSLRLMRGHANSSHARYFFSLRRASDDSLLHSISMAVGRHSELPVGVERETSFRPGHFSLPSGDSITAALTAFGDEDRPVTLAARGFVTYRVTPLPQFVQLLSQSNSIIGLKDDGSIWVALVKNLPLVWEQISE